MKWPTKNLLRIVTLWAALLVMCPRDLDAAEQNSDGKPVIQFSHDRGIYHQPFDLTLSTTSEKVSIRFTTDGSMPSEAHGVLFTESITIDKSTVVHAIIISEGHTLNSVQTVTYIFPEKVLQQPENIPGYPNPPQPVNNPGPNQVNVPLTYGMDPKIVTDPDYAKPVLDGLSQIPSVSIGVDPKSIFGPQGFYDTPRGPDKTKHSISFEFIDPNNPRANIGVFAGISGHSKEKLKRSFHIHFGSKYGGPPKLKAPIFQSAPFGQTSTDEFTNLILRAGNNRSWATTGWPAKTTYTEDEFVRSTQIAMTGKGVHGTFVHLYLNGIYWGLYNLVERPNDGFGQSYFGSKKGDYFSFSQNGVESGDDSRWNYLLNILTKKDMALSENYAEMKQYLDVKQFANYLIGQWFCGVSDWPDTNYWVGGDTSKNQPFQFFVWDAEEMINTVNRFPQIPHGPWVNPAFANEPIKRSGPIVQLWNALKKNPEFMKLLEDEVRKNLAPGGPLSDEVVLARWKILNNSISNAIVAESARWGDALTPIGRPTYTKNNAWNIAVKDIENDLKNASEKFVNALRAQGYFP